eukprot:52770-Amphidinium_carterae.1
MKDLPYASEVLCGRAHCQAEDAVLDVLRNFDQTPGVQCECDSFACSHFCSARKQSDHARF